MKQNRISTDLTKAQWNVIKPLLPQETLGAPARIARKRIVDALWFVVVTGLQWRFLPSRFPAWQPAWQTVYYHFRRWSHQGTWRRIHHVLRALVRAKMGRSKHASAACLDSQSVKTGRAGGERGFDSGKKVKGRKRHLLTDTQGLALEMLVTPANVSENAGAKAFWRRAGRRRGPAKRVRRVWCAPGVVCAGCGVRRVWCALRRGSGNRSATSRAERVCRATSALGGRTHFWLAFALSPLEPGLRKTYLPQPNLALDRTHTCPAQETRMTSKTHS